MDQLKIHKPEYFLKHCEIVVLLVTRSDKGHPSVKHHIRSAIREASNHVGFAPGDAKHSARYMSLAAMKAMQDGNSEGLIAEHVVPVSVITEMIMNLESPTTKKIADLLMEYTIRAVITEEEDGRLKKSKLGKAMPEPVVCDKFARYKAIDPKIELIDNQFSELSKGRKK